MKYFLESFHDYSPEVRSGVVDYTVIGSAAEANPNRKEECWETETEAYCFKFFETLEEAIESADCIAEAIQFIRMSDEEKNIGKAIVAKLMKDPKHLTKYGRLL